MTIQTLTLSVVNNLVSDTKQREFLKREITKMLNSIEGLVWRELRVDTDAYISVLIDEQEKHNAFGELGYYQTVCGFFDKYETLEAVLEKLKTWTLDTLKDERETWNQAMSIFSKRYQDKPKEEVPTRRAKAYVMQEIYQDELKVRY